jgi:hypothetical protein
MQVFQDNDRRANLSKLLNQTRDDAARVSPLFEQARKSAPDLPGDVVERPERRWGVERIAPTAIDALAPAMRRCEMLDERGFPKPGLAADEGDPTRAIAQVTRALLEEFER